MLQKRIIPCLQLVNESLVKTIRFKNYNYIGDPINTVRIFNELEVDELCFLDIRATVENREPNFKILTEIANECFMPLSYGGGVNSLETAKKILSIGFEKIIINSANQKNETLIRSIADFSGNQSVVASFDLKKNLFGKYNIFTHSGTKPINIDPISWAKEMQARGAGELIITSIDKDGTWLGYDVDIINKISESVDIPVIANGGCGSPNDIKKVFLNSSISAVGVGSMFLYQSKDLGVLINFLDKNNIDLLFNS